MNNDTEPTTKQITINGVVLDDTQADAIRKAVTDYAATMGDDNHYVPAMSAVKRMLATQVNEFGITLERWAEMLAHKRRHEEEGFDNNDVSMLYACLRQQKAKHRADCERIGAGIAAWREEAAKKDAQIIALTKRADTDTAAHETGPVQMLPLSIEEIEHMQARHKTIDYSCADLSMFWQAVEPKWPAIYQRLLRYDRDHVARVAGDVDRICDRIAAAATAGRWVPTLQRELLMILGHLRSMPTIDLEIDGVTRGMWANTLTQALASCAVTREPSEEMLRAMHDGPLGANDHEMEDAQRAWLRDMWQAGYDVALKAAKS